MKAIVLAGGTGSRLGPVTRGVSKQLLAIHDQPMIHHPISTVLLAGIRDLLVITTPQDHAAFQRLLGDGSQWGVSIQYAQQERPEGIAQALLIGEVFLEGGPCMLVLGDNVFHGAGLSEQLEAAARLERGARVFAHWVASPERYGVVDLDEQGRAVGLEEKPREPRSNWAVTGLYLYDGRAPEIARSIRPSARGELEITAVNQVYLEAGELEVTRLGRGTAWLDTGTLDSMHAATEYVRVVEARQGLRIGCPEEVAFRRGFIDATVLERLAAEYAGSPYGEYLARLARDPRPA